MMYEDFTNLWNGAYDILQVFILMFALFSGKCDKQQWMKNGWQVSCFSFNISWRWHIFSFKCRNAAVCLSIGHTTVSVYILQYQLIGFFEILIKFLMSNYQANFNNWWQRLLLWNCHQMNISGPYWWYFSIGSGNRLVPSCDKPLPVPMLT